MDCSLDQRWGRSNSQGRIESDNASTLPYGSRSRCCAEVHAFPQNSGSGSISGCATDALQLRSLQSAPPRRAGRQASFLALLRRRGLPWSFLKWHPPPAQRQRPGCGPRTDWPGAYRQPRTRPGLHEVRDEGYVAGETVQLGDHQGSAMLAAELEGGSECGPIIALAAFDLQDLLHQGPVSPFRNPATAAAALRVPGRLCLAEPLKPLDSSRTCRFPLLLVLCYIPSTSVESL